MEVGATTTRCRRKGSLSFGLGVSDGGLDLRNKEVDSLMYLLRGACCPRCKTEWLYTFEYRSRRHVQVYDRMEEERRRRREGGWSKAKICYAGICSHERPSSVNNGYQKLVVVKSDGREYRRFVVP